MNLKRESVTYLISRQCLLPAQTVISVFELLNLLQSKTLLKESFVKFIESHSNKTVETIKTPVAQTKEQLTGNLEQNPLPSIPGEKDVTVKGLTVKQKKDRDEIIRELFKHSTGYIPY